MHNEQSIFTVTVIEDNERISKRCVGFFHELETAQCHVELYGENIREETYNILVIEETFPGFYYLNEKTWWYIWKNGKYIPTDIPERFETTINFGMG